MDDRGLLNNNIKLRPEAGAGTFKFQSVKNQKNPRPQGSSRPSQQFWTRRMNLLKFKIYIPIWSRSDSRTILKFCLYAYHSDLIICIDYVLTLISYYLKCL